MRLIGVFGGTFAPIHNGHIRLALECRERLEFDRIHMIPNGQPPHRGGPGVSSDRRLQWVRMACGSEPGLLVDDREVRRPGASYMIDTLGSIRKDFPEASISLLMGRDSARGFLDWHRWEDFFDLAHLVMVDRPGEVGALPARLSKYFSAHEVDLSTGILGATHGRFLNLPIPHLAISSTGIREKLAAGLSLRGLIPQTVIDSMTPEDIQNLTHDQKITEA